MDNNTTYWKGFYLFISYKIFVQIEKVVLHLSTVPEFCAKSEMIPERGESFGYNLSWEKIRKGIHVSL